MILELSNTEKEIIKQALTSKNALVPCLVCKSQNFQIFSAVHALNNLHVPVQVATGKTTVTPLVGIFCSKCGLVRHHTPFVLGEQVEKIVKEAATRTYQSEEWR